MELTFLGTASAYPTPARGVSCIIFRNEGTYWMFDCGEGSQIQLMKSSVRPGKISRIFISHLHGDHVFGLPGLLCTISQNHSPDKDGVVHIYGPKGLRKFLRVSLSLSRSLLGYTYMVHELCYGNHALPELMETWPVEDSCKDEKLNPNEQEGIEILPDDNNIWHVCEDERHSVKAGWLTHQIPSFGFVIEERPSPGKLDVEILKKKGVPPGPLYSQIKKGMDITLESGEVVKASDCLGPERPGRKVVILGDTSDSQEMSGLCKDCDVIVHEATLENEKQEDAKRKGHSTPGMAGEFAKSVNAAKLILTHFSQRYGSSTDEDSRESLDVLVKQAQEAMQSDNVMAADDLVTVFVSQRKLLT